ncbi:hypothetical protein IWX90DRAFT_485041 [Phyllosticta citrichinensis]|uniref:DUF7907 domain-containing protein n=1 Tax=Phyllosticta citrichinensis TaxID=1130410 RepID=A0ABR1Y0M3_9PEZI
MKISSLLAVALPGLSLAVPSPNTLNTDKTNDLRPRQSPDFAPNGPEFRLQTRLVDQNDTTKSAYSGLYLTTYHTGAGLSDVVFVANETRGAKAFLNESVPDTAPGGQLEFDFGNDFPWGLRLGYEPYSKWSSVIVQAGLGDQGFVYGDQGLVYNLTQFAGWMVCDWWHNVPQLFWLLDVVGPYEIPSSCAEVLLLKTEV